MSRSTAAISRPMTRTASPRQPQRIAKPDDVQVLIIPARRTAVRSAFSAICIRRFAGNVVKAMGGAKQGYPVVSRVLARRAPRSARAGALMAAAQP